MKITSQKGFTGLDERIKLQTSASAASVLENLRITDGGSLTKRPEIYNVAHFDDEINCVWCGSINNTEQIIVASGGLVYRLLPSDTLETPELIGEVGIDDCMMFEFNGYLYIKTHYTYSKYDGNRLYEVAGYIPTVAINCNASGQGELFEQINLLSDMRKQLFSADGTSTSYKLAEDDADVVSIKIDGKEFTDGYFFDPTVRQINFELAPKEGINNIEVIYQKMTAREDRNRIMKCNKIMLFGGNSDGRAFLWGNEDFPNYRFHSELANGIPSVEYFPINAFTVIGNSKINCIAQQYDRQLIFTKNEAYYSYCELRDDGVGNIVSSFPVYSLNGNKGCLFETDGCNIDNRPVTLCHDGLNMWESTSVVNEKNAICFSSPIAESMSKILSGSIDNLIMFDFQANRELYFISGGTAYIYNYGNGTWYTYTNMNC
ncbi:MAG: hypothetical protein IJC20_00640, partial [Clostridia bacterium]|nr:hypothetical protein [Clostridia bacterium]